MRILALSTILVAVLGCGVEQVGSDGEASNAALASTVLPEEPAASSATSEAVWPVCATAWTCDGDIWYRTQVLCNRDCLTGPCYCVSP
jgi:hypothetical protein